MKLSDEESLLLIEIFGCYTDKVLDDSDEIETGIKLKYQKKI